MRTIERTISLLALAPALAAAAPPASPGEPLLKQLAATLDRADPAAYERFITANYAKATLADYAADLYATELAKMYDDTAGLTLDRIAGSGNGWVQAEGRDRISGTRQCLTLTFTHEAGAARITEFTVRGLYDADPSLATPSVAEVVRTLGGLADRYDKRGLMSGVLLIAKDGKPVFERAYGFASIAHRARMTPRTRLSLASIGKSMTGVAVGQLVDAGKLDYDAPVGRYLPDLPDQAVRERATIRQLLSHTSGLGPLDYYQYPQWASARPLLRSVPDYLKLVKDEKITIGASPGKFSYSNAGYVIVGAIIEKVTGQSFYDYVGQHIFRPAGMTGAFYPEADAEHPDVAEPLTNLFNRDADSFVYRFGTPRKALFELAARGGPQGGPVMTARDLLKFDEALRSGKLVSAARLKEMLTPNSPSGAGAKGLVGDVREGLGIEVIGQNGHLFYGHTGGDLGISAMDYWYPDTGYTVILLSNRDPRATRVLANVSRALLTRQTIGGAVPPPQHCLPPQ